MAAPRSDLRPVLQDEWGTMYADPNGYVWRGPEFEPRYAVLHAADRFHAGGWQKLGDWYRSIKPVKEYAPSSAAQLYHDHLDPGVDAREAASSVGTYVLLGGLLYVAAQVLPALIAKRG